MDLQREPSDRLRDATAIALGMVVPAMVSGRAVLQGIAAVALIGTLILAARDTGIFRRALMTVRSRLGLIVLAAFAGMAVNLPGSLDPLRSFDGWARTAAYVGACVLFWAFLVEDRRAWRLALRTFIAVWCLGVVCVLLAQYSPFQLPYRILKNDFGWWSGNIPFHAAKAYAAIAACSFPVILWAAKKEAGAWRAVAVLTAFGQLAIVFSTVNKSALAGLLAMILAVSLAMALRGGVKWLAAWILWAATATAAMLFVVYELPDEPANRPVWDWIPPQIVDTHRQQIWHFTAGKIAEKPWTGYGINVIDRVAGAHRKLPGYDAETLPSHPHNWMLEILAETGVFGFVPVLLAVAWVTGRALVRYVRDGSDDSLSWLGLCAVFWGSSLFNFSIWSSWWLIGFFLMSALIAARPGPTGRPD